MLDVLTIWIVCVCVLLQWRYVYHFLIIIMLKHFEMTEIHYRRIISDHSLNTVFNGAGSYAALNGKPSVRDILTYLRSLAFLFNELRHNRSTRFGG